VAFTQASDGKPAAFYYTVLLNGLFRVPAATGVKAAASAQPRAEKQSIQLDKGQ
jgi:hypothetical protein